jgi:SAM-dependent methyltransferase
VSFDRIARHYRWLETVTFGSVLQKARTCWIKAIVAPKRILILGEGNGRFLCELLRVHRNASVDCVDASARMLELACRRVRRVLPEAVSRVRFLQEDIISWSPPGSYDLLVTNFVLDCFPQDEVNLIVRKVAQAATPNAYLLLADFSIPRKFLSRVHARIWLALMYGFFRATTGIRAKRLADPTSELEANGFVCLSQSHWRLGLVKSELWQRRRQTS